MKGRNLFTVQSTVVLCALSGAFGSTGCDDQGIGTPEINTKQQALSTMGPCDSADPDSPLAIAACSAGKLVGAAAQNWIIEQDPQYVEVLAKEFTYVTPENELKWGPLQGDDPETWDFTEADAVVATAKANGQAIKGHALVWHEQLPSFVTEDLEPKVLRKLMRNHIKEVTKRYREDIAAWDVVNEVIMQDGSMRESVFYNVLGPDYIADAFIKAAEYTIDDGYDAELLYNDWGISTINPKSDGVYTMLADLVARGVPVHGVGMQSHIDARYPPTVAGLVANFQRFADLGLTVNLSELDVRVAGIPGSTVDKLALQQQIYHTVAAACAEVAACTAVTTWGVGDKYSWVDGFFGADDPLLLDESFAVKPAYRGMVDGFLGLPADPPNVAPNLASSGSFETDAAGWVGFGSAGVEVINTDANTGNRSLLGAGRTDTWQGPALDLMGVIQPGFRYAATAFVKLSEGAEDAFVSMNGKIKCGENETYPWLGGVTATAAGFSAIEGNEFEIPVCDNLSEAKLYLNGPAAGIAIILDDVVLRQTGEPLGPELVSNGDFETDTSGWWSFGPASVSLSTDAHSGSGALLASDRTDTWQGPGMSLLGLVEQGVTYRISAFAKLVGAPEAGADLKLTVKSVCGADQNYGGVSAASAANAVWTELNGSYQVPFCNSFGELTLYLEGPAAGVDLIIDDVSVAQRLAIPAIESPTDPDVIVDADFESNMDGWYSWGNPIGLTSDEAHTGSQSLLVTGAGVGKAVMQMKSLLVPGETYQLSYWVTIGGDAESADVRVTNTGNCGSGPAYDWLTGTRTVTAGTWVELTGSYTVPTDCDMTDLQFYVEGGNVAPDTAVSINLFVDDVSITQ